MQRRIFNKLFIFLSLLLISSSVFVFPTYAAPVDCATTSYDEPDPRAIVCPIIKMLNVLVLSAGAAFVGMLFFSAYKFAMSQGDPKGVQGAKDTATLALIGFIIVIGFFVITTILKGIFGVDSSVVLGANGPFDAFVSGFQRLLNFAGVTNL